MARPSAWRPDVAIVGGGVAGLWLLARLRHAGYSALLLESQALGTGQSIAAQGIIHGGVKYALGDGADADPSLAPMPGRWRACLAGTGDVDLRGVQVAAAHQLFWVGRGLKARIAGMMAAHVARGQVSALDEAQWPPALRGGNEIGAVYRLDETVLDVPSLLGVLGRAHAASIKAIAADWRVERDGGVATLIVADGEGRQRRIEAKHFVFAAGAGNEQALAALGQPAATAQRRPLHMLLLKGAPAPLWAHCFGASAKPLLSITSHRGADGAWIWYIGGALAEDSVGQSEAQLITATQRELARLLPQHDFSACRFAGWRVDRAEAAGDGGRKPAGPVTLTVGNATIAWPTKLAQAPLLADQIMQRLPLPSGANANADGADWPSPPVAAPPWESVSWI